MIRLASWIIGSLIVAGLAAWIIALPGTLTLELAGYRMQPRLGTAVVILLLAAALGRSWWASCAAAASWRPRRPWRDGARGAGTSRAWRRFPTR